MSQIEIKQLVKEYKRKNNPKNTVQTFLSMIKPDYEILRAVDHVNLSIDKGEAVGYVGPNGSGKSTTIKILCGILKPTSGTVRINGLDPFKERIRSNKQIGVVFGNRSVLWWDVPVVESYRLFQKLYDIPPQKFHNNLEMFTEIMELAPLLSIPERQLSLGQKMKCNIAAAFLHDPQIVFLDEPTIGLDTESKAGIRKFIRKMNEEKKATFIVTSHDFQDIESICQRIVLINHGKILLDDHMQQVKINFNQKKQILFEVDENPWYDKNRFDMEKVQVSKMTPHSLQIEYDANSLESIDIIQTVSRQCEILDIAITSKDVESIIHEIIKKDIS